MSRQYENIEFNVAENGKQALHFSNKGNLKLCVNDKHKQNTKNKF